MLRLPFARRESDAARASSYMGELSVQGVCRDSGTEGLLPPHPHPRLASAAT